MLFIKVTLKHIDRNVESKRMKNISDIYQQRKQTEILMNTKQTYIKNKQKKKELRHIQGSQRNQALRYFWTGRPEKHDLQNQRAKTAKVRVHVAIALLQTRLPDSVTRVQEETRTGGSCSWCLHSTTNNFLVHIQENG